MIIQRPYDVIANPSDTPKAIFISAVATAPLAASHEFALQGREKEFQAGIDALTKLTEGKVHLSVQGIAGSFLNEIKGVVLHKVSGKHPAGNVGVQISKIDPLHHQIGHRPCLGSQVENPEYYSVTRGAMIGDLVVGKLKQGKNRIISGGPLTGTKVGLKGFLGFYDDSITVLPEGDYYKFFGWMPFTGNNKFSVSRTFLSWLSPNKEYELDTNLNGEERAFVITGEMEKVMPLDIYPMQLLKATMVGDIEKMENLGIYEVAPEDFALIDFISSSKIEAQEIIREGLDLMIKEVG